MKINIKDALELSDHKQYLVISKAKYKDLIYYFLLDINNKNNFKFCYLDENELVEITDAKLISELIPILAGMKKGE